MRESDMEKQKGSGIYTAYYHCNILREKTSAKQHQRKKKKKRIYSKALIDFINTETNKRDGKRVTYWELRQD